jgi:hypothetical protein
VKAITDGPLAAIGKQRCIRRRPGLRLVFAAVVVVFVLPRSAFAGTDLAATIPVLVYSYAQVPPATLARAEREADKILGAASVQVVWLDCLGEALGGRLEGTLPRGLGARESGAAAHFRHQQIPGFRIWLCYDSCSCHRVLRKNRASRPQRECHVRDPDTSGLRDGSRAWPLLLGTPEHSRTGIMQAKWGRDQIRQALTTGLQFTPQQSRLIREQVRRNVQQASLTSVPANVVP